VAGVVLWLSAAPPAEPAAESAGARTSAIPAPASPPPAPAPSTTIASLPPTAPPSGQPASPPATEKPPSFDIVKVDPVGNAVIAGRAAPGSKVQVLDGGKPIGEVTADGRGEWVLVPTAPLSPGDRQLSLEATDPQSGKKKVSTDTVALAVAPPAKDNATVAILVPSTEEPVRALQVPGEPPAAGTLSLDTAEIDAQGKLALAGHAAAGASLNVYAGEKLVGTVTADDKGNWSLQAGKPKGGEKTELRIDQLTPGSSTVARRVAVPFEPPADMSVPNTRMYVVKPGNSLWWLARRSYGNGVRYTVIYQANRDHIRDPNLIYPGQVFLIPKS